MCMYVCSSQAHFNYRYYYKYIKISIKNKDKNIVEGGCFKYYYNSIIWVENVRKIKGLHITCSLSCDKDLS